LNAVIRNQCFTHIQPKNQQQPLNSRDESNDNGIGENINKNIRKNDNNNNDQFSDTDETIPYHLSDEYLSKNPHNVLIAEALRSIKSNLTHHNVVTKKNAEYRQSEHYINNRVTFDYLLEQVTLPKYYFFDLICSSLYPLYLDKEMHRKVRIINDCVRIIRHDTSFGLLKPFAKIRFFPFVFP
jgi:hypothetical protein